MDRVKFRAEKARNKIEKMRREWQSWKGEPCKLVRVNHRDFLALTEMGYVRDGYLSGTDVEVRAA